MKSYFHLFLVFFFLVIISCSSNVINEVNKTYDNNKIIDEVDIVKIELEGEISSRDSEISGLCWYNDKLILLPQYPNRFDSKEGKIFYITKNQIENYLLDPAKTPLKTQYLTISLENVSEYFGLGSGFEAVIIVRDTAYFSIESMNNGNTESILILGIVDSTLNKIDLIEESIVKDPYGLKIHNISNEAIISYKDKILPIYEVFGKNINESPKVSIFNHKLEYQRNIDFPTIEYRITDATEIDDSGRFWAINYFYPGDNNKLNPALDELLVKYGYGRSHMNFNPVERLVQFKIDDSRITITDRPPIYLALMENNSRNWEGLVKFDENSFILATDTFPETIIAYLHVKP